MRIYMKKQGTGSLPSGNPIILGEAIEDSTLTADISSIVNNNGINGLTYAWYRNDILVNTDTVINLSDIDVGKTYRLEVTFTDGLNREFTLSSTTTPPIQNINDAPTGTLTIIGDVAPDRQVQRTGSIGDADGKGTSSYQWQLDGVDVPDATGSTFHIPLDTEGSELRVKLSYTDLHGTPETVYSDPYTIRSLYLESRQAFLNASDASAEDKLTEYDGSVSISDDGNTLVAGTRLNNNERGAAYVFTRTGTTWSQKQKLTANDGSSFDWFGMSASISGDGNTIAVGAMTENSVAIDGGAAYIFTYNGSSWSQQAKLLPSGDQYGVDDRSYFGRNLELNYDGNTVVVGAYRENNGTAYIFNRSGTTWSETARIEPDNSNFYGAYLDISDDGNTVIIGAYYDSSVLNSSGALYVLQNNAGTWSQEAKLIPADLQDNDHLGWSVGISGDGNTIVGGASHGDIEPSYSQGAAYVYTRTGGIWTEQQKIQPEEMLSNGDFLGWSVSVSQDGSIIALGAISEDTPQAPYYSGTGTGAIFIYVKNGSIWEYKSMVKNYINPTLANGSQVRGTSLGQAIDITPDGSTLVSGSRYSTPTKTNIGVVTVFV